MKTRNDFVRPAARSLLLSAQNGMLHVHCPSPEIMDKMAAKSQLLRSIDYAEHNENYSKCMNNFQKIASISIWDLFKCNET